MNILGEVLGAGGGQTLQQLARQFGLDEQAARNAVTSLLPSVSQGLKQQMSSSQGLESLFGALTRGDHTRYIERPETLSDPASAADGNGILGHIFGSKEVSRDVAAKAASSSGVDLGILKQMLPLVAGMAMGAMSKQTAQAGLQGNLNAGDAQDGLGGLAQFLDMDGDGSVADDLLGFARKLF